VKADAVAVSPVSVPTLTPAEASQRLARLGFLALDLLAREGQPAHLVVALHDRPTLEHFDSERITFWRTGVDRRGHRFELTRETPMPFTADYAWGKITLRDRVGAENDFVSVGGTVTGDEVAPGRTVVVFASPGPILRLGGHSQPVDALGSELGAFFARMMVPIDFVPGAEQAISASSPLDRYVAFVAFKDGQFAHHAALRADEAREATSIADEAMRLQRSEPAAWGRGVQLLERLGLRA
jgi:hypothetical protein